METTWQKLKESDKPIGNKSKWALAVFFTVSVALVGELSSLFVKMGNTTSMSGDDFVSKVWWIAACVVALQIIAMLLAYKLGTRKVV